MAFILNKRVRPIGGPIDVTSLINVVLLLLFFFLLSSSFILQPGVVVDPPSMIYAGDTPSSRLIVAVTYKSMGQDASGAPLPPEPTIFFQDQIVKLAELPAILDKLPLGEDAPPLIIKADQELPSSVLAQLLDIARAHRPPLSVIWAMQEHPAPNSP